MNMETGYELNVPVGDGNKDVKAIISNNEVIWERAIPTPKSGVAPLTFRATRAKPLLDWEITGKTYQALTPTPSLIVGNNKLDNSKIEKSAAVTNFAYTDSSVSFGSMTVGSTINSAEIKAEDTSYAFSFTGDTNKVTFVLRCYNSSHVYLGNANKIFDEASRAVMTTLANTAYVRLYITTTVQGNISLTNLMLNKGNTISPFEPFVYLLNEAKGVGNKTANLCPPYTDFVSGYISATGAVLAPSDLFKEKSSGFIPVKPNAIYTFSYSTGAFPYDKTDDTGWRVIAYYRSDKTFIVRSGSTYATSAISATAPNDAAYARVSYRSYGDTSDCMLNEGSTELPYVPHGYEIPVVDEGDNLLDEGTIVKGYYLDNEFTINDENDTRRRSFSIILNAGTYTLSGKNTTFIRSIINGVYSTIGGRDRYTFTITERSKFGVSFRDSESSSIIWTDRPIMLNEGSTALPYKPYEQITTPIYLDTPLMADEILKSDGTREVKWGMKVLTGTENWDIYTRSSAFGVMLPIDDMKVDSRTNGWCNHFTVQNSPYGSAINGVTFGATDNYLYFTTTNHNTLEQWKTYLSNYYSVGSPVIVYYPLATSILKTIEVPEILTAKNMNTLSINTEVQPTNIDITYLSSGFEPQPLKTSGGQILYTNNNQIINTLE